MMKEGFWIRNHARKVMRGYGIVDEVIDHATAFADLEYIRDSYRDLVALYRDRFRDRIRDIKERAKAEKVPLEHFEGKIIDAFAEYRSSMYAIYEDRKRADIIINREAYRQGVDEILKIRPTTELRVVGV